MVPRPARQFVSVLLMAGAVTLPSPAAAFRDCCHARSIPPRLIGVTFNGPIDEVLGRLERAGFGDYDPGNRRITGLGYVSDAPAPAPGPLEPGGIGWSLLGPSIARFEMACGHPGGVMAMPMGGHPNGARMLRTVIAVVADLDRSCAVFEGTSVKPWRMAFGPAYDDPTLGARVREARFDLGALRLIAPKDKDGPAARWLAAGGPRWIGFAVEVGDLVATEQWLNGQRVRVQRESSNGGTVLRIDPDELGGLVVEFVPCDQF